MKADDEPDTGELTALERQFQDELPQICMAADVDLPAALVALDGYLEDALKESDGQAQKIRLLQEYLDRATVPYYRHLAEDLRHRVQQEAEQGVNETRQGEELSPLGLKYRAELPDILRASDNDLDAAIAALDRYLEQAPPPAFQSGEGALWGR